VADRNGARITDVYTDNDSSAYKRPATTAIHPLCETWRKGALTGDRLAP